jgi:hypothetical protein
MSQYLTVEEVRAPLSVSTTLHISYASFCHSVKQLKKHKIGNLMSGAYKESPWLALHNGCVPVCSHSTAFSG